MDYAFRSASHLLHALVVENSFVSIGKEAVKQMSFRCAKQVAYSHPLLYVAGCAKQRMNGEVDDGRTNSEHPHTNENSPDDMLNSKSAVLSIDSHP